MQQALQKSLQEVPIDPDNNLFWPYNLHLKWPYFHHCHQRFGNGEEPAILQDLLSGAERQKVLELDEIARTKYVLKNQPNLKDMTDEQDEELLKQILTLESDNQTMYDYAQSAQHLEMSYQVSVIYQHCIAQRMDDCRLLLGRGHALQFNRNLTLVLAKLLFPEAQVEFQFLSGRKMAIVYWPQQNIVFDLDWYFCHGRTASEALAESNEESS